MEFDATMSIGSLTIPSTYVRLILDLCKSRGINLQLVAKNFDRNVLEDPNGRFKVLDVGALLYQAVLLDEAIGYEIGLNTQLTSHGFVGYGILTTPTFRDALDFGIRYAGLRTPFVTLQSHTENDIGIIEIQEAFDLGPTHRVCMEHFLIGIWRMAQMLMQATDLENIEFELHFDYPEPECHDQYRSRLPQCHFSGTANQLRFPAEYLELPLATADETAAQMATKQCEQEKARTGEDAHTVTSRLRALFEDSVAPPSLSATADHLHISPRSLKRKLQEERTSFQVLVDQHRERLARARLKEAHLSVTDIAAELGYTSPENFSRAFRKWTGLSPTKMRAQYRTRNFSVD